MQFFTNDILTDFKINARLIVLNFFRNMSSQLETGQRQETLDQKKGRLDFDLPANGQGGSSRVERAFADISSELGSKNAGEKYNVQDIGEAISKRFDASIKQKTQNLNPDEKAELLKVKQEILSSLIGKNPKEMLEEFANLRDKLYGIIAASDGKSGLKDKKLDQARQEQVKQEETKKDAFERFQDLLNTSEERRLQEDARRRNELQAKQIAEKKAKLGDQTEALAALEGLRTLA
ncbi:MAG: hypothetical protein HHAS10_03630 [Candidatus Altimarinota bacterium]